MIAIEPDDAAAVGTLLDAPAYSTFLEESAH